MPLGWLIVPEVKKIPASVSWVVKVISNFRPPGAVKVAVHRLRQRYRELLRASVADTVADPLEVDGELQHLMTVLA